MADESVYAAGGESNKRKYEDSPPPVGRRSTGFSSPSDSAAPPSSYNSVPPPMNEIELAKQKAQEIAARLLSNADPSKRARVESNGAGGGSGGFDAVDTGVSHKHPGLGLGGPPQSYGQSYGGYPGPSKKIEIPNGRVGVIIGKGGDTIKYLQLQSGAKIQVTRDMDADPSSTTRGVELMGTPDQIAKAEQLINDVLSEAEAGGSGIVSRRLTGQPSGTEQIILKIANNKVGLVIGKGGETIKSMQARTGARIQVIPLHLPPGDTSKERTVQIDGTSEQIEAARQLVEEVTSENRMRNQSMSGGYSQQGYHRPPNNWQQPGPPSQQPGYGYVQPGAYPGPPQYGMNQPPYPGYPQPGSGGYGSGWDQSSAQNQHAAQGGSYDYYNQQAPPQQQQSHGAPVAQTDGSAYGYSQSSAYGQGQGYGQDGYGGYHAGYGQPQQNPNGGYDKQQQGYGSAYGNAPNRTPDGHTPPYGTQSDPNQASATGQSSYNAGQPSPNPSYPHQASSQPGYGAPPSSQGGGYGVPNHPTEVTVHLQLKNRAVSQRTASLSSHLVLKAVAILNPGIHLSSRAMVNLIRVHRGRHHHQVTRLSPGMVPRLMEHHHRQLKLAMVNSSLHNMVVQPQHMVEGIHSLLQLTLLRQLRLNQHNPAVAPLPKHHLPVD